MAFQAHLASPMGAQLDSGMGYDINHAYSEYNLETILIVDPLARTRETKYIGHKGKWYKRLSRLFKDKYNYLPAYFVSMTPALAPQPNLPMKPHHHCQDHNHSTVWSTLHYFDGNGRHYGAQLRALALAWAICILYYQVCTHPMVGITHGPVCTLSQVNQCL
ncbi:hypothetical protein DSO57_1012727 [Entomophthora muscae]|uniref:Uncharacterized protein n=1 Tax=Entomophthora muscae TaxID=34485 RepID=A0ACC2U4Z4_9FUNG|nr:hypothetical protein DSO57_1012727 [Entomophthora muscae]